MGQSRWFSTVWAVLPLVLAVGCGRRFPTPTLTPTATLGATATAVPTATRIKVEPTNTPTLVPPTDTATPALKPATSTPVPRISTPRPPPPAPSPTPAIQRIQFAPGATSATVAGCVERQYREGVQFHSGYVLRAFKGQTMKVAITSPNDDVLLSILGADGVPIKRYVDGEAAWEGTLHATQDYFIRPVSVGGDTCFGLLVVVSPL